MNLQDISKLINPASAGLHLDTLRKAFVDDNKSASLDMPEEESDEFAFFDPTLAEVFLTGASVP